MNLFKQYEETPEFHIHINKNLFIKKDGEPVATAQVFSMSRIGQFYADEHSGTPGGSLPPDEVRAAFDEYMAQAKAWRKAKRARRAA